MILKTLNKYYVYENFRHNNITWAIGNTNYLYIHIYKISVLVY